MPMILVDMVLIYSDIMWVKQCHKPSHSHHHFNRCYVYHSQSWVVYAYGPKTVLVKRTFLQTRGRRLCWGGVGWGGHVNVLSSAYIRCCYAAEISVVSLLRYMLLCCRDPWYPCYVTWARVKRRYERLQLRSAITTQNMWFTVCSDRGPYVAIPLFRLCLWLKLPVGRMTFQSFDVRVRHWSSRSGLVFLGSCKMACRQVYMR